MKIQSFIINYADSTLEITFLLSDKTSQCYQLPFEYLRVFSPQEAKGKQASLVTHKKLVKITQIESVAKHGSRLLFDDQHSAIYSDIELLDLAQYHDVNWQDYLAALAQSGHSREATIDIKQL